MARGALLALLCVSTADAAAARLKANASLHARPNTTSEVVAELPAGTRVEVLSESSGWHEVKGATGQGFVRSDQLVLGELGEPAAKPVEKKTEKAEKPAPRPEPPREVDRVSAEELRQLTEEVRLLRERPEPATAADLQRIEATLTQAIAALREKAPAPDDPPSPEPPPDTSIESVLAVSPVLLIVGGVIGWVASRVTQRRRDGRNRIRV